MTFYTYYISLKFKYVTFIKFLWNFIEFNFNEIREVCIITPISSVQEQRDKPIIMYRYFNYKWSAIAQSVWRLAAEWKVRG